MRRFKIGSAKALVWVAVSLALWCGSAASALAQTYDFSFTAEGVQGSAVLVTNGSLGLISGTTLTFPAGVSGTLSSNAPGASTYGTMPMLMSTSAQPYFSNTPANDPVFFMSNDEYDIVTPSTLFVEEGGPNYFAFPISNESLSSTPAPIPGTGVLSYLALGLGGLFFYRKRLWRAAREVTGMAAAEVRHGAGGRPQTNPPPAAPTAGQPSFARQ